MRFIREKVGFKIMKDYKIKKDSFRKSRGGSSKMLDIKCAKCGEHIATYQKDGPGPLKRMYMDRIFEPSKYNEYADSATPKKAPAMKCGGCGELVGSPYVYDKEKRPAYRMFQSAVIKGRVK